MRLTPDEIWLGPVAVQTSTELDYCREECALAVEVLRALPSSPGVVAEGTALLPHGVVPHLSRPGQAVWLVPTPEFQRHAYPLRGPWPRDVVAGTSNPAQAFDNWMERDVGYGRVVVALARALGQSVIDVDGRQSVSELYSVVADRLAFSDPQYPTP